MLFFRNATLALLMTACAGAALAQTSTQTQVQPMTRRSATPPLFAAPASGVAAPASDVDRDVKPALEAANLWLSLIDINRGQQSWEQTSDEFRQSVSADSWVSTLDQARVPLGSVVSRKVKNAAFTRVLPGQPDGEYVVVDYNTSFKNKPNSLETLTLSYGIDKRWRVAGYQIK